MGILKILLFVMSPCNPPQPLDKRAKRAGHRAHQVSFLPGYRYLFDHLVSKPREGTRSQRNTFFVAIAGGLQRLHQDAPQ